MAQNNLEPKSGSLGKDVLKLTMLLLVFAIIIVVFKVIL
jgi:hypothetical protein